MAMDALELSKGKKPMGKQAKKAKKRKASKKEVGKDDEGLYESRKVELEEENRRLQAEVAYLKKLKELIDQQGGSTPKNKKGRKRKKQ